MTRSPFPGMDPYLEAPTLWPDVHTSLMIIFREQLTPLLAPHYLAELETQVVIDRVPIDTPTRLVSIHIRQRENEMLVAVIELLSLVNKRRGQGREEHLEKRRGFLNSPVHLIEIDLLRCFPRMPFDDALPAAHYIVMVCDVGNRPNSHVRPISVRQPLPTISIPLLPSDPFVPLDMGQALRTAYERARYDLRIDYRQPPIPSLSATDAEWASERIRAPRSDMPTNA